MKYSVFICAEDVKYIKDITGLSITESKAMAMLMKYRYGSVYSETAERECQYMSTQCEAKRFAKYLEIKALVDEFGPLW